MDTMNLSDKIKRTYDLRRTTNYHIRKQRQEEIYSIIPEYMKLDTALPDIALARAKAIILNNSDNALDGFTSEIDSIDRQKRELLTAGGYPADYLDPIYTCPDCHDTGYIGSARCHCYKDELMKFIYESSNISSYVKSNNFDNFNIDYYPDDYNIDESTDATPRDIIRRILKTSHDFIDSFGKNADNLLIYGHSGVGKTFLTHCIAGEILKKGYSVIYLTSYQLFDILETKVFHSEELDETGSSIISMLYTCDLLIIDDLGTEMINKFTEVQLFACLQERLAGKHSTIISTNLSFDDIKNNYSERIFSRLIGNYKLLKIIGSDIRITKALYENGGTK